MLGDTPKNIGFLFQLELIKEEIKNIKKDILIAKEERISKGKK